MAAPLPIATVRSVIETDLTDPALQLLMDDANQEILTRLGVADGVSTVTEVRNGDRTRYHFLLRKAASVTSVTIRLGVIDYPLGNDDFELDYNGRQLQRMQGSTLPDLIWSGRVTVVYAPVDDTVRRNRLFIDLVRLAVQYDGQKSVRIGDANTQPLDYLAAKNDLFKPFLSSGRAFLI